MQGFLLQIEVAEIVVHEACEPNAVVDFLDTECMASKDGLDIDVFAMQADAAARRDQNITVVERVSQLRQPVTGAW